MSGPADALHELAGLLRADGSVVSPHVSDPEGERPVLGELAAAGERTAVAPAEYALVVEAVREGYLLHYGEGRVVCGADADLALLAGDYLYALGLERLAALGDLDAVRELSDLISLSAQVHDGVGERVTGAREAGALWLASALAIAVGPTADHQRAKSSLRASDASAAADLWAAASAAAAAGGLEVALREAADSIDFDTGDLS
jgi:hypothetical protein